MAKSKDTKSVKSIKGSSIRLQPGPFGGPPRYNISRPTIQPSVDGRQTPFEEEVLPPNGDGERNITHYASRFD